MSCNTVYKCFCSNTYNYDYMKKIHYTKCEKFKERFCEMDNAISKCIKQYIEKIDSSSDYINQLLILKFFLKRYVNLIGDIIQKENANNNNINLNPQNRLSDELIGVNKLQHFDSLSNEKANLMTQIEKIPSKTEIIDIKEVNMDKDEKDLIKGFYQEVPICSYNDVTIDDLRLMSKNISNLISTDCFVLCTKHSRGLIKFTTCDDDEKYYILQKDDIYFYVIFYS